MAASPVAASAPEAVASLSAMSNKNAASSAVSSLSSPRDAAGSRTFSRAMSPKEEEALKRVRQMGGVWSPYAASPGGSPERKHGTFKHGTAATIACLLFVITIVVAVVVYFINAAPRPYDVPVSCNTLACLDHVQLLGLKQYKSSDACEDFGQFVCSGWRHNDTFAGASTESFRLSRWLSGRAELREEPGIPITKRVRLMMDACLRLEDTTTDTGDSGNLIEFMSKELFPWLLDTTDARLGDPDDYSVPLRVLVKLSVLWATPLWFFLDFIEPWHGTAHRRSVSMSPSGLSFLSEKVDLEINNYRDLYTQVVWASLAALFPNPVALPAFTEFAMSSIVIQRSIIGNLSLLFNATHPRPRYLLILQLPALVPKLKSRDWVGAFQSVFKAKPPLTEQDTLVTPNGSLLDVMHILFSSHSAREVTFHTALWFIRLLGPITSSTLRSFVMKHPLGNFFFPMSCALNAALVYTVIFSGADNSPVLKAQRLAITDLLSNVHKRALAEVGSLSTLDTKAVRATSSRLQNTSTMIWPLKEYMTNRSLERLYGRDYGTAQSFFEHWRKSREQLQKSLGSEEYQASLRLFRLQSAHLAAYNPVTNVISISVSALSAPYYDEEGTDAMAYGGLGFMYAMQLVRTINALTVLLSDDATQTPWTPTSAAISTGEESTRNIGSPGRTLWELGRCTPNATSGDNVTALFPLLPALKIAHTAYLHFRNEDRDERLRGMEEYSAEQVFFLTACHVTCWQTANNRYVSPECTEAMRNFEPFAKAFACPAGSHMNPEHKCTFF